jgi:hypothetical protein
VRHRGDSSAARQLVVGAPTPLTDDADGGSPDGICEVRD